MSTPTKKKVLYVITKSNWGEKRMPGASQEVAYYSDGGKNSDNLYCGCKQARSAAPHVT